MSPSVETGAPLEFTIRPARPDDDDAIKEAVQRARLDRTGLDWRNFRVAESRRPGEGGSSAEGSQDPPALPAMLGFCQIRRYRGVRELGSLYVRKAQRGQGIGAALVRACLAGQTPPIHLECVEDRQSYYEQFGFRRISKRQAPLALRLKSTLGGAVVWLALRKRIIVMRWDGDGTGDA